MSTLAHHGVIYVPFGYSHAFSQITNLDQVHGGKQIYFIANPFWLDMLPLHFPGSPWGAGTFSAADGSRQPTPLELEIAQIHGKMFWETVSKVKF